MHNSIMVLGLLRQVKGPTQRSSRVISLTRRKDGPGRPYSLPHARMSLANPKENVPYGSERSSTLCSRLAKAREGSDRITLSAPVEQKAKGKGRQRSQSTLCFRLAPTCKQRPRRIWGKTRCPRPVRFGCSYCRMFHVDGTVVL